MNLIELCNVSKVYQKGKYVISKLNLSIKKGDFVVVIGPSGCGKTTLLNMIAGLEEITEGTLKINDVVYNDIEPKDRNISMIFQNYTLYSYLSVYDNMAFPLKNKKVSSKEIENIINKTSKMLKIENLLNRKPSQLSGGEKQRVAIGRAIVRNPIVFLMDEPLSNLDVNLRNEMREEIKKLHDELNTTIIYVTHDQIEALTMANKIVVMDKGVIQQIGSPLTVYDNPKNEFVACFLGNQKMNIFENIKYKKTGSTLLIDLYGYKFKKSIKKGLMINDIDIGIRSENIKLVGSDDDGIIVHIDYYELIGEYYILTGNINYNNQKIIIKLKLDSDDYNKDNKILKAKPINSKVLLFDGKTKERIYEK